MQGEGVAYMIRRLRTTLGWSQSRLAREMCRAAGLPDGALGRQDVYRYEKGTRSPREWLPALASALGVPLSEMQEAVRCPVSGPPVTVTDFLPDTEPLTPLTVRQGRRIGVGDVADLAARVHRLRLADDFLAGGDLIGRALRELKSAVRLYRAGSYTDDVGRALLSQIGELSQIVGWIAADAGRRDEAERVYRLGLSASRQAEDTTLAGNLAGSLAYMWSNNGQAGKAIELARASLTEEAPPKARALAWDRLAWAHTQARQAQPAMAALGRASEALATDSAAVESPRYTYWLDRGELDIMECRVYTELRRPLRAVPILKSVLETYDVTRTREHALYLSWLAVAYADANEPEEAGAVTARIMAMSEDMASDRIRDRLRVVIARLAPHGDVPEVRRVLDRAQAWRPAS
jgi:tetratricopeptide (TPR) repeat protein